MYRSRRWLPRRSRSAKKHGINRKVRCQNTFFNLLFHSECFLGSRVLTHEGSVPSACQRVSTWRGACLNPPRSGEGTALHTGEESFNTHASKPVQSFTETLILPFHQPFSPHLQNGFLGENAKLPFWLSVYKRIARKLRCTKMGSSGESFKRGHHMR